MCWQGQARCAEHGPRSHHGVGVRASLVSEPLEARGDPPEELPAVVRTDAVEEGATVDDELAEVPDDLGPGVTEVEHAPQHGDHHVHPVVRQGTPEDQPAGLGE